MPSQIHQLSRSFIQIAKNVASPRRVSYCVQDNNWFNDYRSFLHTADVKLRAVPVNHYFGYFYLTTEYGYCDRGIRTTVCLPVEAGNL